MPFCFGYDILQPNSHLKKKGGKGETESRFEGWKKGCDQSQGDTPFGAWWYFGFFSKLFKFSKSNIQKSAEFAIFAIKKKQKRLGEWLTGSGECSQGIIILGLVIDDNGCKRTFD